MGNSTAKPESKTLKGVNALDAIFKNNPNVSEFYRASDGTPFFTEGYARMYATENNLKDKTIKKITKCSQE
jgi:hypothetical protein